MEKRPLQNIYLHLFTISRLYKKKIHMPLIAYTPRCNGSHGFDKCDFVFELNNWSRCWHNSPTLADSQSGTAVIFTLAKWRQSSVHRLRFVNIYWYSCNFINYYWFMQQLNDTYLLDISLPKCIFEKCVYANLKI